MYHVSGLGADHVFNGRRLAEALLKQARLLGYRESAGQPRLKCLGRQRRPRNAAIPGVRHH